VLANQVRDTLQLAEVCQAGARTGVAVICTCATIRARNNTVETGDESVAIWAAVPLSRVAAPFGDFSLPNNFDVPHQMRIRNASNNLEPLSRWGFASRQACLTR